MRIDLDPSKKITSCKILRKINNSPQRKRTSFLKNGMVVANPGNKVQLGKVISQSQMSKQKTRAPHLLLAHWQKENYLQLVKSNEINQKGIILSQLTINDIHCSHIKNHQNDQTAILAQLNCIPKKQQLGRPCNTYKTESILLKLKILSWWIK